MGNITDAIIPCRCSPKRIRLGVEVAEIIVLEICCGIAPSGIKPILNFREVALSWCAAVFPVIVEVFHLSYLVII